MVTRVSTERPATAIPLPPETTPLLSLFLSLKLHFLGKTNQSANPLTARVEEAVEESVLGRDGRINRPTSCRLG